VKSDLRRFREIVRTAGVVIRIRIGHVNHVSFLSVEMMAMDDTFLTCFPVLQKPNQSPGQAKVGHTDSSKI
jgi:hypothetical protein